MRRGFTLVEVLVALAILAVLLLALVRVEGVALRAERGTEVRRRLATALVSELALQRDRPSAACLGPVPVGWTCSAGWSCAVAASLCDVLVIRVRLAAGDGAELSATTAVAPALRDAPTALGPASMPRTARARAPERPAPVATP